MFVEAETFLGEYLKRVKVLVSNISLRLHIWGNYQVINVHGQEQELSVEVDKIVHCLREYVSLRYVLIDRDLLIADLGVRNNGTLTFCSRKEMHSSKRVSMATNVSAVTDMVGELSRLLTLSSSLKYDNLLLRLSAIFTNRNYRIMGERAS